MLNVSCGCLPAVRGLSSWVFTYFNLGPSNPTRILVVRAILGSLLQSATIVALQLLTGSRAGREHRTCRSEAIMYQPMDAVVAVLRDGAPRSR